MNVSSVYIDIYSGLFNEL